MTETAEPRELVQLDRGECLRLLAGGLVGRVVFTDAAMPAAQPVNYVLDGEEIIFRTAGGSKLAATARRTVVAFQADEINTGTHTGWDVLGVGEAYEVTNLDRLAGLVDRQPAPWAPGHIAHTIAIPLQRLTGRRVSADDRPHIDRGNGS